MPHVDSPGHISARLLAAALATRLSAVVPLPIRVVVEDLGSARADPDHEVIVRVLDGAEPWSGQGISDSRLEPDEDDQLLDLAGSAAVTILDGVQDSVSRILREPWPRLPSGAMAMPAARADEQHLYLWYGSSEDNAVVTLKPIAIKEITLELPS